IVDRSVDGQPADIAAGEEDGRDDKRVGGEGQASAVDIEHRLVVELIQNGIGKRREKNFFDQLSRELSAAAVAKNDLLVLEDGQRTRTEEWRGDSLFLCLLRLLDVLALLGCPLAHATPADPMVAASRSGSARSR